ncbi:hypothetical protein [Spartinivicinus poritis]|uniref:Uncharacterized protein n=1 Tax=Spartinivicinus poritis TaxID=2994640 RepID=A0ABT5UHM8_9GAMM|nr:hypothetical protein [Spartinivicinus sp. A2-2]MDE1465827.1 hypothetical protein [Spartinivicinus sp. A2-2]
MAKRLLLLLCLLPGIALSQQFSDNQYRTNESASLANTLIPGGWTLYRTNLSRDDYSVFFQAMSGFTGVKYTPFAVSTQVVAGTNYKFICNGESIHPDVAPTAVIIKVHRPLHGEPEVLSINDIQ